jgi:hypothetical protein
MRHLVVVGLVAIALVPQPTGTLTDPDAYAVYNALIPSNWLIREAHAKELLIQDTTRLAGLAGEACFPTGTDLIGPWALAAANLKQQNAEPKLLLQQFNLAVRYRLETKDTIDGFFKGLGLFGWETFHAAYPDAKGFLWVSAVGFDEGHDHAIVYVAHLCGGLCGEGG